MTFADWIDTASLAVGLLALLVGTAVTFVVHGLSRRLDFRTRIQSREELASAARGFAAEMHIEGLNSEVLLLNADTYEKAYDGGNKFTRRGYLQLRAEFAEVQHDGLAFIGHVTHAWHDSDGHVTLTPTSQRAENVLVVGHIPFEWIEHINPHGNEFKNAPLVYSHFRGPGRSPYAYFTYHEAKPTEFGPRARPYYRPVLDIPNRRLSRLEGWKKFWTTWWRDRRMLRAANGQLTPR